MTSPAAAKTVPDAKMVAGQDLVHSGDGVEIEVSGRAVGLDVEFYIDSHEIDVGSTLVVADGSSVRAASPSIVSIVALDAAGRPVRSFPHQVAVAEATEELPGRVSDFTPGIQISMGVDGSSANPEERLVIHTRATSDQPWTPLPSMHEPSAGTVTAHTESVGEFVVVLAELGTSRLEDPVSAVSPQLAAPEATATQANRPVVVLDPDDDLGFAEWPSGRLSELEQNLRLVDQVRADLVGGCDARVVITRGAERFVAKSIRAAVAAAAEPDLTVTLAFNTLTGEPWGSEDDGGVLAWASSANDAEMAGRFLKTIPRFTGRPSTDDVREPSAGLPYPELDAVPGPYAHIELLYLDHNFDFPVIDRQFSLVADATVAAIAEQLRSEGHQCDGVGSPEPPSELELTQLRDLGYQNHQVYGADPISFSTGNFIIDESLFSLSGVGDQVIDFTLTYNGLDERDGSFGVGWSFVYNSALQVLDDDSVLVRLADGRTFRFMPDGLGGWDDPAGSNASLSRIDLDDLELEFNDSSVFRFDLDNLTGHGLLKSTVDRQGNTMTFDWDRRVSGTRRYPLASVEDQAGQRVELTTADGRVQTVTHPDGRQWMLDYDGARLVAITDPRGVVRRFEYSLGGLMSRIVDGTGAPAVSNIYDDEGRVTKQVDAEGNIRYVAYEKDRTVYTDANGNETMYLLNDLGQVTEKIDAFGESSSTTYDDDYNPVTRTDPNGNIWRTTYDDDGRPIASENPEGEVTAYEYNEFGDLVQLEQPDGLGGLRTTRYWINEQGRTVKTTYDDGSVDLATYDDHGDRTSATDANGNTTTFQHDDRGNLISVTDAEGGTASNTYDLANRVVASSDANGGVTLYRYDAIGNVVQRTDPDDSTWVWDYDANNVLVSETDPLSRVTRFTYDANSHLIRTDYPDGTYEEFELDGEYRVATSTDKRGNSVHTVYDRLLRPVEMSDELGGKWRTSYDAAGNPQELIDPEGNTTTLVYDSLNRVVERVDPNGHRWTTTYNAAGNVTTILDPAGQMQRFEYDTRGRQTAIVDQEGHRTLTSYDPVGNVLTRIDRRGYVTGYEYDKLNRVKSQTNPDGGVLAYEYDARGNVVRVTDPRGGVVETEYDRLDRPVRVVDQNGSESTTTYNLVGVAVVNVDAAGHRWDSKFDVMNRLVARTSPLGDVERTEYDDNGNISAKIAPDGTVTRLVYDARNGLIEVVQNAVDGAPATAEVNVRTQYERSMAGRLVASVDANRNRTEYRYDPNGNLIEETDPLGRTKTHRYDEVGYKMSVIDGNGNETRFQLDPDGQPNRVTYSDGSVVSFTYDADNFQLTMTDDLGVTSWERDWRGNAVSEMDANGNAVSRTYDLNGNVVALTYPDGFESTRVYDPANRLTSLTDHAGTIGYQRDALGRAVVTEHSNRMVTRSEYDEEGKLVVIDHTSPHRSGLNASRGTPTKGRPPRELASALRFEYRYAADDIVAEVAVSGDRNETTHYVHDGLNRLVESVSTSRSSWYTYDAVGNRLSYTTSDDPSTSRRNDAMAVEYHYDAANQLGEEIRQSKNRGLTIGRTYDKNGNQIQEVRQRLNRKGKPVGRSRLEEFRYNLSDDLIVDGANKWIRDGLGRAMVHRTKKGQSQQVYDGFWLVQQIGAVDETYVRDDDQALRSQTRKKTEVLLYDLLGTIHAVANKNGNVRKVATYDDFGALVGQSPHRSVFGFAGELQDQDTNRLHFLARSYDTYRGRFLQQDRIAGDLTSPMSNHQYMYAFGSPLTFSDYLGHIGCCGIDIDIPNPIDAAKSVGGKVISGGKAVVDAGSTAVVWTGQQVFHAGQYVGEKIYQGYDFVRDHAEEIVLGTLVAVTTVLFASKEAFETLIVTPVKNAADKIEDKIDDLIPDQVWLDPRCRPSASDWCIRARENPPPSASSVLAPFQEQIDPLNCNAAASGCRSSSKTSPDRSGFGIGPVQAITCLAGDSSCAWVAYYAREAIQVAGEEFPGTDAEQLERRNAFQHAYWMGLLERRYGAEEARRIGLAHEIDQSEGTLDTQKDLINNDLGIQAGQASDSDGDLRAILREATTGGYLACLNGTNNIAPCR
ncbi:MAG: DUF6531 domain-containing protein [Acidimicrobiales bacterium]